jgi:U3 small nucleolar RNA-associated protein 25
MGWTRRFDAHFDPASCGEGVSLVWRKACEAPLPREKPVDPLAADAQAQVAAAPLDNTTVYLARAVISEAEPPVPPRAQATPRRGRRKSAASADQGFSERLHKRLLLHQLPDTLAAANAQPADRASYLPPAARAMFEYLDTYRDMYATQWDWERSEHYRLGYVLHGANHALRARDQVLRNTRALAKAAAAGRDLERRDQSFRPARVVFVVPFRHQALKIVGLLEALLVDKARDRKLAHLKHKKKFSREYSAEAQPKPHPNAEYRRYFEGNLDDCFALGIRLRRHSVHLYADLHQCDIIVASPLGLRRLIGAEGDSDRDFDFLNGVEVAIVDQADVMQMQNLEHLKDALAIMNAMPRETGEADILRMRHWALEGLGRHFRQTALLSAFATPELNALALRGCHNLAGRYRLCRAEEQGSVRRILRQVPQIFRRLEADSPAAAPDAHFEYFCEHVLPTLTGRSTRSHVLVVLPSYFDFVRVRNHLKRQQLIFAQICEYTTLSNVSRARTYFYHGERRFMLYTERFHFHNRPRLRSVKHIVFYQPPVYPQIYAELVNSLSAEPGEEVTVTVAFTRYDALRLTRIVGDERATRILSSERDTHMFL